MRLLMDAVEVVRALKTRTPLILAIRYDLAGVGEAEISVALDLIGGARSGK